MFITALFIIPQKYEQSRCPSTHEWKKKSSISMCVVSQGHHNKLPQTGQLKLEKFILLQCCSQKSKIKALAGYTPSNVMKGESFLVSYSFWWLQACFGFLSYIVLISISVFTQPSPFLCLTSSLIRIPVIGVKTQRIIQDVPS